jgi:hypothetical protein
MTLTRPCAHSLIRSSAHALIITTETALVEKKSHTLIYKSPTLAISECLSTASIRRQFFMKCQWS